MRDPGEKHNRLRVLFVCAFNQWRSPTAEHLYRNDPRLEVRSAGVRSGARRRLSSKDLEWAEVVFVMDREQRRSIHDQFAGQDLPDIRVLEITEDWPYMDPRLQEALVLAIESELAQLLPKAADGF
ncbi:MAG: hypothetical protein RJA22_1501 [Verrucomicrobiota bacterium]|jgi:predicted protein tyrosine phosphatase